jgi:hypothetical protein
MGKNNILSGYFGQVVKSSLKRFGVRKKGLTNDVKKSFSRLVYLVRISLFLVGVKS